METMPMNDPMIMIWFSYIYAIMLSRIGKVDTKAEFIHNNNLIEPQGPKKHFNLDGDGTT